MTSTSVSLDDRIFASLCAAGIGDALGAQTEQWSIDEIAARHGGLVTRFGVPPPDTFAGAQGGARAEVTDDTSQMVYLARALVESGGKLDTEAWVRCLLDWAATSPKAGFMGPSTERIVAALRAGQDVSRVGTIGTSLRKMTTVGNTNGAAMRVAPCGLVHPGRLEAACELAFVTCLPSHDTDVAIASACCIAAGTAGALVVTDVETVIEACVWGAAYGERLGRERARTLPGPRLPRRLDMALSIAHKARDDRAFLAEMDAVVGTGVLAIESVPAAVGVLAYAKGDPLRCVSLAASIGNDTDTVATMAGALAGALVGPAPLAGVLLDEFLMVNEPVYRFHELASALAVVARSLDER